MLCRSLCTLTRKNAPDVFNVKWPARSSRQAFSIQHESRIKVFTFEEEGRKVPYTCTQCDEAWCMQACPVDSIKLDATTGAKVVQDDTCVGCKVCTIACPFGTINYVVDTGKVAKCDLCGGDPACAKACPTDAITFVDSGWTGLDKMRKWAAKANEASL